MCTGGELCAGVKACSGVCRTEDVYRRRAVGRGEGWRKAGIGELAYTSVDVLGIQTKRQLVSQDH